MEITNLSVQDICAIIGALAVVCSGIYGLVKLILFIYKKYKVYPANIRANFFKQGKSWRLRIYNASEQEIEAKNIKVSIPDENNLHFDWECEKDVFPSLKRHANLDIRVLLYTNSPDFIPVTISWEQGRKSFSTTENIQLRC